MKTILNNREIVIRGLRVDSRIGFGEEERSKSQELLIDLRFSDMDQRDDLGDEIDRTVDYKTVADRVTDIAAAGERRLIETLADEVAEALILEFRLSLIEVTVRKFILPETEYVSVTVRREALS